MEIVLDESDCATVVAEGRESPYQTWRRMEMRNSPAMCLDASVWWSRKMSREGERLVDPSRQMDQWILSCRY